MASLAPQEQDTITTHRPRTRWLLRPPAPPDGVHALCRTLAVPPLFASALWGRGYRGDALEVLDPPLELTAIPDLARAAERLEHALKSNRRILIHGDYDADGISGTALLTLGLRALGGNVTPFIPHRLHDGYGISPERVEEHVERADLFLTVDCGISNLAEIARLQTAGVEVIISDHHHPGEQLPECLVVHPQLSPYAKRGLPALTGAGVAYHLLWALHERLGLNAPLEYSDIASIGTIADVAPLMGENRALIKEGLTRMADSAWPGVRAVVAKSLAGAPTARDVAFVLAPRLNAAGRLGEAELGLELLLTASERRARELASYLDMRNQDRRKIQDEMFEDALTQADPDAPALVLADDAWHPGVMGIVASKLLERFYKPVFIIAQGKGSVRSTPGISAVQGLKHASAHLKRYGGHTQAAGFAIDEAHIAAFRSSICAYVAGHPTPEPQLVADALLAADEVDDELYRAIQGLEPYGEGHPAPLFALSGALDQARAVGGGGKHLQLRVEGVKGVAWQQGGQATTLSRGATVSAAISLRENFWQDKRSLEFIADEVRLAEPLSFHGLEGAPSWIHRGAPAGTDNTPHYPARPGQGEHAWTPGDPTPETLWLRALPLEHDDPLRSTDPLAACVREAKTLYFDLDERALLALEQRAASYPTVQDTRRMFVRLSRGERFDQGDIKAKLASTILEELELLDPQGRPYRGKKRDPYSSETLLRGLMERYKLKSFCKAYRYLDEPSFAQAVHTLFGNAEQQQS